MNNELFSILIDAAKNNYQSFMHNVWTALGSAMVAIGWILTSEAAREFICNHSPLKWILIGIISVFIIVHVAVIRWHKRKSEQLLHMLSSMEFVKSNKIEQGHLEIYCIPKYWIYVTSLMNTALLLVLMYLIFEIDIIT